MKSGAVSPSWIDIETLLLYKAGRGSAGGLETLVNLVYRNSKVIIEHVRWSVNLFTDWCTYQG